MTSGHWVPEMVDLVGGRDDLGSPLKPARRSTWEEIGAWEPEKILLMPCGFDISKCVSEQEKCLRGRREWLDLSAVKKGEVYALDANAYYSRSGPRLVDGLEILAKVIHPELFGMVEPGQATRIADL